jgi:hypothetical protein
MNRRADDERRWNSTPNGVRRHGVAAKMHARRAAGEGHVEAIVHDDARRAAARQNHHLLHQVRERRGFEVPFPDLQVVDARIDGMTRLLEEASPYCAGVP